MAKKHPYTRRRLSSSLPSKVSSLSINPNILEKLYINFIVSYNMSFYLVECSTFYKLLVYLKKDSKV